MYYKKLNIDNFERIQDTLVPYILNYINHNLTEEKLFYNLISENHLQEFKQDIPELFEGIRRELGSEIIFASHLFVDVHTDVPIHTDSNNPSIKKSNCWPLFLSPHNRHFKNN